MRATDFKNLLYSPDWCASILHHFLSGAQKHNGQLKFELLYLALPFSLNDEIVNRLVVLNKRSTFDTAFDTNERKNTMIGANKKVHEFMPLTNQGLIALGNRIDLKIDEYISINKTVKYNSEKNAYRARYFKAAYNWGNICAKSDYLLLIMRLGVIGL